MTLKAVLDTNVLISGEPAEDRCQRCPVLAFHGLMVPEISVIVKGKDSGG
jgi:hypothetical protein